MEQPKNRVEEKSARRKRFKGKLQAHIKIEG